MKMFNNNHRQNKTRERETFSFMTLPSWAYRVSDDDLPMDASAFWHHMVPSAINS